MKRLFIGLLVVAAATWLWVGWRTANVLAGGAAPPVEKEDPLALLPPLRNRSLPARELFRPVEAVAATPERIEPRSARKAVEKTPTVVEADSVPAPLLKGFLGGTPPMAILGFDGKTEIVLPGQVAFGWTVTVIDADKVVLRRGKRVAVLAQP